MDRLIERIAELGNPSVVGLDPTPALLPAGLVEQYVPSAELNAELSVTTNLATGSKDLREGFAQAYLAFNTAIIDAIADLVPAVKPQIAMYEALGLAGLQAYVQTCRYAAAKGLYVLGDVKRGDIGSTASMYACLLASSSLLPSSSSQDSCTSPGQRADQSAWTHDAITVNPYLGVDGIDPFVQAAIAHDKDLFVLVHTSNPSSQHLQDLELANGQRLYEHVGALVEQWGSSTVGQHGYSRVGAVVGATYPAQARRLRELMPHTFFLVPGYGAQGGSAADVMPAFDAAGSGALVNSSRGIIGAWRQADSTSASLDPVDLVATSARLAAERMRDDLRAALAARG